METLKLMLAMVRRQDYESDHVGDSWEGEAVVRDLIRDYGTHRARVAAYEATNPPGGARVGGNDEPSGVTPLTKPCDG